MPTINTVLQEWKSKRRRMGCVAAAEWWIKRLPQLRSVRRRFYYPGGTDENGQFWEHVILTDGCIEIDPSPWSNKSSEGVRVKEVTA